MHIIAENTLVFEKERRIRNNQQATILSVDTIQDESHVDGIKKGFEHFGVLSKNLAKADVVTKKATAKLLHYTAKDFDEIVAKQANDEEEKPFEFYGGLIAQSLALDSQWMLRRTNGLMEKRGLTKSASTEVQGIVSYALNTILQINVSGGLGVDTGWMELYSIIDMTGISSGKIINIGNHIKAQKLVEGVEVKQRQPISSKNMEDTNYSRYGINMTYNITDRILTEYFTSMGGVNGLFRDFRIEMARTKSMEAYRAITKKPTGKYTYISQDFVNQPISTTSTYADNTMYRVDRFVRNLGAAYLEFIKQAALDGERLDSATPDVHMVYNPFGPGADVVTQLMTRLNNTQLPYVLPYPITFHASMQAPLSGAWEEKVVDDKTMYDSDGFEVMQEADSELSFGVMLVLAKGGNIHGVNNELYNMTMEYPPNESIGYFTFERWTNHAARHRRYWVKNLVPIKEIITTPIID